MIEALSGLAHRVGRAVASLAMQTSLAETYVDTLKSLVDAVDLRSVYTRGHSPRVARHAHRIAVELGLPKPEADSAYLAGYLHDLGMASLEGGIAFKGGRFSDEDYESSKVHVLLGSALVEPVDAHYHVASGILHHHERFDGLGYPGSLKGEAIPLQARIVAAADFFNAKLSNRSYRSAMPFEMAVYALKASAGSQLDPSVVEALILALDRMEARVDRWGLPLEPCWEMMQCPESIRTLCPAGKGDLRCWEIQGVHCDRHGSEHSTCPVFTEYQYRIRLGGSARNGGSYRPAGIDSLDEPLIVE